MAPGVAKSFVKELKKVLDIRYPECNYGKDVLETENGYLTNEGVYQTLKAYRKERRLIMNPDGYEYIQHLMLDKYCKTLDSSDVQAIFNATQKLVEDATHQAMEAVIHNLNSMHVRQVQH